MLAAVPAYALWYWTRHVTEGLVLAISCLGLLVLVGWAREISLAQAGLTGSALYLCQYAYWPATDGVGLGWSFPMAAGAGIAFTVIVSLLTALVAMRLAGPYVIVLTLAVQFWLENSIMVNNRINGGKLRRDDATT